MSKLKLTPMTDVRPQSKTIQLAPLWNRLLACLNFLQDDCYHWQDASSTHEYCKRSQLK
ncbi:MAG: hypothetical protein F6K21_09985 [Symploca sp. SIO2D2]|nr:hypothetical protein [Symploca sp. SIO2D2]